MATVTSPSKPGGRAAAWVLGVLRPIWVTAFRDPVIEGRLRLEGLPRAARIAGMLGVIGLVGLLASVVFSDFWRAGELLHLDTDEGKAIFLPAAILPVTLIAFALAWVVTLWGAFYGAPVVRVAAAVLFILVNASLGTALAIDTGDSWILEHGPTIVRVVYFVVPGLVLVHALMGIRPALADKVRPFFILLASLGVLVFFGGHLLVHIAFVDVGFSATAPTQLSGAILEIDRLLTPLLLVAGVLVIDFGLDVAEGAAIATRSAVRHLRWLLVGLIVVRLWVQLFSHLDEWATYIRERPDAIAWTLVCCAALVLSIMFVRRIPDETSDNTRERLMYGGGFVLAAPTLVVMLILAFGFMTVEQFDWPEGFSLIRSLPTDDILIYGRVTVAAVGVLVGLWLLRSATTSGRREAGAGILMISAWSVVPFAAALFEVHLSVRFELLDVLVTFAVITVLALRWKRLTSLETIGLIAILIFSWLTLTRGDWLAIAGGAVGLPEVFIVVVGVALSVLQDSAFSVRSSKRLPRVTRALIWIGYLVLSVAILNWLSATHEPGHGEVDADMGYFYLGIPLAAWLIARRLARTEQLADTVEASDT